MIDEREPSHEHRARWYLAKAERCTSDDPLAAGFLARAQVHATLALVEASQPIVITINGDTDAVSVAKQLRDELKQSNVVVGHER